MKLISTNPSRNYQKIGEVKVSTIKDIKNAVLAARKALPAWLALLVSKRVKHLSSIIPIVKKQKEDIAKIMSLEMGRPITSARVNVDTGLEYLSWYLENAEKYLTPKVTFEDDNSIHTVYREAWGVVACIEPWNFPFANFVWQCGQTLLAGNTIVFKNSEENPLFTKKLAEIIKLSSLPKGVFNVLYGDGKVGGELIQEDIDMICFTGSTKVGHHLAQVAAQKFIPVLMELGGSAPGIVFEDADIDKVIDNIYFTRFMNCGQSCNALKRLIVHKSKFDEVVEKLKKVIDSKKVGDATDEATDIGPLVAKRQVSLLEEQVEDALAKGAKVGIGGKRPKNLKGAYFLPTILLNIKKNMRVWQEEVFGPVLPVVEFSSEDEAVKLANDTKYGLGGYVYTRDKDRFDRVALQIQTGMVGHNNVSYYKPSNPFGGYKKSGMGREHGEFGFHDVTQVKVIAREK